MPSSHRHSWHTVIGALLSHCVLRVVLCPCHTQSYTAHTTHSVAWWSQKTYTFYSSLLDSRSQSKLRGTGRSCSSLVVSMHFLLIFTVMYSFPRSLDPLSLAFEYTALMEASVHSHADVGKDTVMCTLSPMREATGLPKQESDELQKGGPAEELECKMRPWHRLDTPTWALPSSATTTWCSLASCIDRVLRPVPFTVHYASWTTSVAEGASSQKCGVDCRYLRDLYGGVPHP